MSHVLGDTEKDPPAHKVYAEKKSAVLKKLVEISPRDPEVLQLYANTLQDPDEKAAVLAKIVALNPSLTDARYELGLITARKGKTAEGIQMVEDAIAHQGDPDSLRNYVQRLINLLDEVKCPLPDAEQWNTKLNEAYDKATQGAGAPAVLSDYKKGFLEVVGKQPCASASKSSSIEDMHGNSHEQTDSDKSITPAETRSDQGLNILKRCRIWRKTWREPSRPPKGATPFMKTVYWIATVLLCLILLFTGYLDMTRNPQMLSGMATLDYPEYFLAIDGTAKFLAVLAILIPGFATLREWAYAGITFLMIGAAWSHLARQQSPLAAITVLALAQGSYWLWRRTRTVAPRS